jgi:hypothetical protein
LKGKNPLLLRDIRNGQPVRDDDRRIFTELITISSASTIFRLDFEIVLTVFHVLLFTLVFTFSQHIAEIRLTQGRIKANA